MSRFTRVVVLDWSEFPDSYDPILEKIDSVLQEDVRFLRDFARL